MLKPGKLELVFIKLELSSKSPILKVNSHKKMPLF